MTERMNQMNLGLITFKMFYILRFNPPFDLVSCQKQSKKRIRGNACRRLVQMGHQAVTRLLLGRRKKSFSLNI